MGGKVGEQVGRKVGAGGTVMGGGLGWGEGGDCGRHVGRRRRYRRGKDHPRHVAGHVSLQTRQRQYGVVRVGVYLSMKGRGDGGARLRVMLPATAI